MKQTCLFVVGLLFLFSCEKEGYFPGDNASLDVEVAAQTLPQGKGVQMVNKNQTDDNLIRGVAVRLPFFLTGPVTVKVGTWATLTTGVGNIRLPGPCPEQIAPDLAQEILDIAVDFTDANNLQLTFDGQNIEVPPYFRPESISSTDVVSTGECAYLIPWRYYVVPQSKGSHIYHAEFSTIAASEEIIWGKP